ncbi:Hypothetical predicted protein [Paramuricea clavata]|uniref:Uncharacterized protein n=1 Tax=Paramuricea clavata TaxID=317549 RepID=A0A7D9IDU4_PARCT|nr:Hypothetical predicted protein [Paramuricea clavata]
MNALGGFDQITAAYIKTKYGERGGVGTAEEVLNKWASRNRENNNVGALKKILEDTMQRDDVVEEIEKWEKLSVCHGCGIRLNKPYRMVTIVADEKPRTSVQEASSRSASMSRPRTRGGPYERESSVSGGPGFSGRPSGFERRYRGGGRGRYGGMRSGSGNNSDRNAAAAGFNAVPSASAFNTGGFGGATHSFGNIGSVTASTGYGGTQANAMGNSGFFGDSGVGAFVSQSGGVGHQAVQNYTNVVNFNLGTSISQEGNEWQGSN